MVESSSVDYNQFTHPGLRKMLHSIGFSQVHGLYELLEPDDLVGGGRPRRWALVIVRRLPVARLAVETFSNGTHFYCVK